MQKNNPVKILSEKLPGLRNKKLCFKIKTKKILFEE